MFRSTGHNIINIISKIIIIIMSPFWILSLLFLVVLLIIAESKNQTKPQIKIMNGI